MFPRKKTPSERTIYDSADRQHLGDPCSAPVSDPLGCDDSWCEGCPKCGLHHPRTDKSGGCSGFQ